MEHSEPLIRRHKQYFTKITHVTPFATGRVLIWVCNIIVLYLHALHIINREGVISRTYRSATFFHLVDKNKQLLSYSFYTFQVPSVIWREKNIDIKASKPEHNYIKHLVIFLSFVCSDTVTPSSAHLNSIWLFYIGAARIHFFDLDCRITLTHLIFLNWLD